MHTRSKLLLGAALVLGGVIAASIYLLKANSGKPAGYRFAGIERGDLTSTVSSTGTLNAVITVQVGSQVSGQIKQLLADFNSEVQAGQVIARIDQQKFETQVQQAEAELAVAQANVAIQRANISRAQTDLENAIALYAANKALTQKAAAALEEAGRNFERKRALFKKKVISETQMDEAQTTYDQALAQWESAQAQEQAEGSLVSSREAAVEMAKAQLEFALAQVRQRKAALAQTRVDLDHTVIRSPVDGIVIERSVDIGQTVTASLQTPQLFTIAQDLRKMQVETDVDEADIGRLRIGQRVIFSVDAFPGKEFTGRVLQIRKAPHTLQNVVTYTVVVSADNTDLQLLPGMTANVNIVVAERVAVLKIPNSALRFRPPGNETANPLAPDSEDAGPPEERLKRLADTLDLSTEQQSRMRALFVEIRRKVNSLRRQGNSKDEIQTAIKNLRDNHRRQVLEVLSAQQREIFLRLAAARDSGQVVRGRVWVLNDKNLPIPVNVSVGISDGQFTEMVAGDLTEGQHVIVGMSQGL